MAGEERRHQHSGLRAGGMHRAGKGWDVLAIRQRSLQLQREDRGVRWVKAEERQQESLPPGSAGLHPTLLCVHRAQNTWDVM